MPQVDLVGQTWVRARPDDLAASGRKVFSSRTCDRLRPRHSLRATCRLGRMDQLEAVSL